MKALTIKQPWATLIALGLKKVENRSWATGYRGPLAIHAGKAIDKQEWAAAESILLDKEIDLDIIRDVPYGGVVAIAQLNAVHHFLDDDLPLDVLHDDFFMGDAYGWILDDIRPVDWFPCPGQLGLWELDYNLEQIPEPVIAPGAIALQQDIFGGVTPILPKKRKPTQLGLLV